MNRTRFVLLSFAFLAAAAFAVWYVLPRTPRSLAEAVEQNADMFPPGHLVLLPPTAESKLGHSPLTTSGRRTTTSAARCFSVTPTDSSSFESLTIKYRDAQDVSAELKEVLGTARATVGDAGAATMTLTDLTQRSGIGIPIISGTCDFSKGGVFDVITSEVVAGSIDLVLENTISGSAAASASSVTAQPRATVDGKWEQATNQSIRGKDIVISGAPTRVEVRTESSSIDLGTTPPVRNTFQLPLELGTMVIDNFHDGEELLSVRVETQVSATQAMPPGVRSCATGQTVALRPAERCNFLLATGNAIASVEWTYVQGAVRRVALKLTGYRVLQSEPGR
jgi:hypothetical protein